MTDWQLGALASGTSIRDAHFADMTMFFFHARNATGLVEDPEGLDLADLDAARAEAIRSIRSILSDEVGRGRCDLRDHIDIADADGTSVMVVRFDEAVTVFLDTGDPAAL